MVTQEIGNWFKDNREGYNWPEFHSRDFSELVINVLLSEVQNALDSRCRENIQDSFAAISYWKTGTIHTARNYKKELEKKSDDYYDKLLSFRSFDNTNDLNDVIPFQLDEAA